MDHSNFLQIVEGSEAVRGRWAGLCERAIGDARESGVTLEPSDCLDIRELRLAAMGAPLDENDYQAELLALPALSTAARKKAIQEGDAEARAAAVADINRGRDNVPHAHHTAHAARRLSEAREMGVATPPPVEPDTISRDERLRMLQDVAPSMRISLARRWGLL